MQLSENNRYETEASSLDSENCPLMKEKIGVKTTRRQAFLSLKDGLKLSPLASLTKSFNKGVYEI